MSQSAPSRPGPFDTWKWGLRLARQAHRILPNSSWNMTRLLEERAHRDGSRIAIAYLDERYTWKQVDERANQYANFFESLGLSQGDKVAVIMDNRPDFLFVVHGLAKLGVVAALINTNLTGGPLVHAITVARARRVVTDEDHLDEVEAVRAQLEGLDANRGVLVQCEGEPRGDCIDDQVRASSTSAPTSRANPKASEVFCYIYTSGTTGLPKAAIITHQRVAGAGHVYGQLMHRVEPGELIYVPLPLYHSSAMFLGWGSVLATGAGIALRKKFSASSFIADVKKFRAVSFLYIGELCRYLLNTPVQKGERDHHLRVGVGNGMRPDIWTDFQDRFGVPVIREFYGATEGNTPTMNLEGRPGMVGKLSRGQVIVRCDQETGDPLRNAAGLCEEIRPGEIGLLLGKISRVLKFDGYVDREATSKKILENVFKRGDRYFNTGDLIALHEGRWISFADRVGDTFRWKGENVSTNEVAEVLNGAPGVLESNVYGVRVPNSDGRAGMAALSVEGAFEIDAFGRFVTESLPAYQRPLFVRLLKDGMQTTGTLKHQKVRYREEGFDLSKVSDPLFVLDNGSYVTLDGERLAAIEKGELRL